MFGVDLKAKLKGRTGTEANTEPPPGALPVTGRPRATKMFFGVEVEDFNPMTGAEPEAAVRLPLPPEPPTHGDQENTGETRVPGTFSLQSIFAVITVFALLCGVCLSVAIAARAGRTVQRERAESAEEKSQLLERDAKLVQSRLVELEGEKARLTSNLAAAMGELDQAEKKTEGKKARGGVKKKHR